MTKFRKGQKVVIRDDSPYYKQGVDEGVKMIGIIIEINDEDFIYKNDGSDHPYFIGWSNRNSNSYRNTDIELIIEKKCKRKRLKI